MNKDKLTVYCSYHKRALLRDSLCIYFVIFFLSFLCFSITNTTDFNNPLVREKYNNYLTILVSPLVNSFINLSTAYINDPIGNPLIPDVDARIAKVIRERLTQAGLKNADNIEIKRLFVPGVGDNACAWAYGLNKYRVALVTANQFHEIETCGFAYFDALYSGSDQKILETKYALGKALWIIDHEAEHIINNDVNNCFAVRCAIHAALCALVEVCESKPIAERSKAHLITSAVAQVLVGSYVCAYYKRYSEFRADKAVQNNSTSLTGAKEFLLTNYNNIETSINNLSVAFSHRAKWIQNLMVAVYKLSYYGPWATHPHPLQRAQLIQKRIDALEADVA